MIVHQLRIHFQRNACGLCNIGRHITLKKKFLEIKIYIIRRFLWLLYNTIFIGDCRIEKIIEIFTATGHIEIEATIDAIISKQHVVPIIIGKNIWIKMLLGTSNLIVRIEWGIFGTTIIGTIFQSFIVSFHISNPIGYLLNLRRHGNRRLETQLNIHFL